MQAKEKAYKKYMRCAVKKYIVFSIINFFVLFGVTLNTLSNLSIFNVAVGLACIAFWSFWSAIWLKDFIDEKF